MGVLDTLQKGLNSGLDSAERATKKMQLNSRLKEISKRREELMAQLGASLYEETKGNPMFVAPREQLYNAIFDQDNQRDMLQAELNELEAQLQAMNINKATVACPTCGKTLSASSNFCTGCGTKIEVIQQSQYIFCHSCGTSIEATSAFCTRCGAPQGIAHTMQPFVQETPQDSPQTSDMPASGNQATEHVAPGDKDETARSPVSSKERPVTDEEEKKSNE